MESSGQPRFSQQWPLGGTAFIGREKELEELTGRLELAEQGQSGGLVLIAGEPGVGKTRLTLELARTAAQRGWQVLSGHAYESEGMPAYLPFIEALRDYVRACPPAALQHHVERSGPEVALLLPDVASRLSGLAVPGPRARKMRCTGCSRASRGFC